MQNCKAKYVAYDKVCHRLNLKSYENEIYKIGKLER